MPHPDERGDYLIASRSVAIVEECFPSVFLDGHPLRGPPLGAEISGPPILDNWIHLPQIAAVEVYRGASDTPAEFRNPGSNCGAVAVWSVRGVRK